MGSTPSGATLAERRYLHEIFVELCEIESPSGNERACAERVKAELRGLGIDVEEDNAGTQTRSDCGNLLARIPASVPQDQSPGVLLCAHLDTVPLTAPVEPVLIEGHWENSGEGILGADNKAAIAVILALARRVSERGSGVGLELLFTVCEERSLAGARAFDSSRLQSDFGYVFDHASPIGEVVISSPCHFALEARFRGAAAHPGIRPQDGRSAILSAAHAITTMPHGRLDEETTVNVGTIDGGSAINVVPEHCTLIAEVRSLREERAEQVIEDLIQAINEAANRPECDCDVDISTERTFLAYQLPRTAPAIKVAEQALQACGYEPVHITSGGASDANALIVDGLQVVNLANGTERNHEPGERVSSNALDGMLDVAFSLLDYAATQDQPSAR